MTSLLHSRRLSIVPRWTVVQTIRKQNVAEHSFQVAQICRALLDMLDVRQPAQLASVLERALDHDMEEAITGDIPSPCKDGQPVAGPFEPADCLVKLADDLEALAFVYEEQRLGNTTLEFVEDRLFDRIKGAAQAYDDASVLRPTWPRGAVKGLPFILDLVRDGAQLGRHPTMGFR